jgi:membrane-associated protein
MSYLLEWITSNASHAHYLLFFSLMMAGMNVPISEDLMIILGALLASTVVPENTFILFTFIFLGCYLSDWVSYWIGRKYGRKLWNIKWFAKTVSIQRIHQTEKFYHKYGFWTLLIGRFIPFGVRNCLFITAGIGRMHFGKFLLSDGIACFISNNVLFWLTFYLGKNYHMLVNKLKAFNLILFSLFVVTLIGLFWYNVYKKKSNKEPSEKA